MCEKLLFLFFTTLFRGLDKIYLKIRRSLPLKCSSPSCLSPSLLHSVRLFLNTSTELPVLLERRYVLVRIYPVSREGGCRFTPPTVIQSIFLASQRIPIGSKAQETPPLSPTASQWTTVLPLTFLLRVTLRKEKSFR